MRDPSATRDAVLNAAYRVLERDRGQFTLEAVAAEAKVSKGGLLHHFGTKHALLSALIARCSQQHELKMAGVMAASGCSWLEAHVQVAFAPDGPYRQWLWVLVTAVQLDRSLLEESRAAFARWQGLLDGGGVAPGRAAVVRLAVQGWALHAMLGLSTPSGPQHLELQHLLEPLAQST